MYELVIALLTVYTFDCPLEAAWIYNAGNGKGQP